MDVSWDEAIESYPPESCVPVESNHPLYILYTSGTTGKEKKNQINECKL